MLVWVFMYSLLRWFSRNVIDYSSTARLIMCDARSRSSLLNCIRIFRSACNVQKRMDWLRTCACNDTFECTKCVHSNVFWSVCSKRTNNFRCFNTHIHVHIISQLFAKCYDAENFRQEFEMCAEKHDGTRSWPRRRCWQYFHFLRMRDCKTLRCMSSRMLKKAHWDTFQTKSWQHTCLWQHTCSWQHTYSRDRIIDELENSRVGMERYNLVLIVCMYVCVYVCVCT
jgi:hypothetical protein